MAAAWKLPMVWFIENNCYGVSTEIHRITNTPDLASRAAAYGVPYAVVDVTAERADGQTTTFRATVRVDTPTEGRYYQHGGILPFVLRSLL